MSDLRFAARMLAKSPGFTGLATLLLTLGIGANAVIFSALDAVLLRPLPVQRPEQLVRMVQHRPRIGTRSSFTLACYRALHDHAKTLASVFGQNTYVQAALNEPGPPAQIRVHLVTPDFFEALGVPALYGRAPAAADNREAGTPPAVLSYAFWRDRFHGDPRAVGGTLVINRRTFAIVAVMPPDFNGISTDTRPDVRLLLRTVGMRPELGGGIEFDDLELAARLRPGFTRQQAEAECQAIWRGVMEAEPDDLRDPLELEPLERGVSILRDRFGTPLIALLASVGLLQLMVCANLAGLLLARGAARREEMAVRRAVGATRIRLVRQMLVESGLLAALGTAGGVVMAFVCAPLLVRALPPMRDAATEQLTLAVNLHPDGRVLLFALAVSVLTALLCGIAPALSASRASLDRVLRGSRSATRWPGARLLVVLQVALCTLLLAGAGLLVRTFQQLRATNPGFDRDHLVSFTVDPAVAGYNDEQAQALRIALVQRVRDLPGVISAGAAGRPLMRGSGLKVTVTLPGHRATRADFMNASTNQISPGYLETLGMRILAGQNLAFIEAPAQKPLRVLVNQAFVRRFFANVNPVGRLFGHEGDFQIAGVVSDAKYRSLREPMTPTFYSAQSGGGDFVLYVRTPGPPEAAMEPVRQALAALDPALPFTEVHTMAEEIDSSTEGERLTAGLASIFGALAAMVAAIGIYGLLAGTVAGRRREIGIRMALGARPSDIGGMIGRQALAMVVVGVALGIAAAFGTAPLIRSLLYDITPLDPRSLGMAAGFVAAVAALAAAIPALRAVQVEPATALRDEN